MKTYWWLAAAALGMSSPALATSTLLCRSTTSPGSGPTLALTVGAGAGSGVTQALFRHGQERFATGEAGAPMIGQAWIDRDMLMLDILDANADAHLLHLDTRRQGPAYAGMLVLRGRTWRVRCDEAG